MQQTSQPGEAVKGHAATVAGLISCLVTVRDGAPFVGEAVDSLLAQTDIHFEVLVVNDGSTDDTAAILARYTDPRVRVVTTPPQGRALALTEATQAARGELFAILDADDVALPERLATQRAYLREHPEVALVGAWAIEFGGGPERIRPAPTGPAVVRRALGMHNPYCFSSVMFRRAAYEALGGFREETGWGCDLDLLIRMAERHAVEILPLPLVRYRVHPAQATASRMWERQQRRRSACLQLQAARKLRLPIHLWVFPLLAWLYAWLPVPLRPRRWKDPIKGWLLRFFGIWKSSR